MGQTLAFMKSSPEQETKPVQSVRAEPSNENQHVNNQPNTNQPVNNQPNTNQLNTNQPAINQPAINRPAINQPAINQPVNNRPNTYQPTNQPTNQPNTYQLNTQSIPQVLKPLSISSPPPSATSLNSSQIPIESSKKIANMSTYNNSLQQYTIIVNQNALKNCIISAGSNISNMNNCILSNIRGTNKIDDYTTTIVNLTPNNSTGSTVELTQDEISNLVGANFTAYDINNSNQFNNIKINLVGLQQAISAGILDVNTSILNNVYGFDTTNNQFKPVSIVASNYTSNSTGNLVSSPNQQNFELLNNYQDSTQTKTIILVVCIILYLIIITK